MDLYTAVVPVFYLSRVLGLAPYRLSGQVGGRRFHLSKPAILYSCLVLGTLLACYVTILSQQRRPQNQSTRFISVVNDVENGVDSFNAQVFILLHLINGGKIIEFFSKLDEVDCSLHRINLKVSHRYNMKVAVLELLVGSLPSIGYYLLNLAFKRQEFTATSTLMYLVYWISFRISRAIIQLCNLHFVSSVLLLKQRFRIINNELMEFVDPFSLVNPATVRNKVQVVRPIATLSLATVKHLKYLHNLLCDLTDDVNYIYSITSLLFMAAAFINLTNGLNNCFQDFISMTSGRAEEDYVAKIVSAFYSMFFVAANVVLLTTSCALTSDEANYTAILVHKLLLKAKDPVVNEDLQVFSMQLLHHKVKFSACGFFPLDSTLLYSIVGGVTTYLVILIQFQLAPPQSQANTTIANITSNTTH